MHHVVYVVTTYCLYLAPKLQPMVCTPSHIYRQSYGTLFQIYIEQVLAYMTLNEELDNMNLRNNFGYSYVNVISSMYLISYFVIKFRLDTRRN